MKVGDYVKIVCDHADWTDSFGEIVSTTHKYSHEDFSVEMKVFPKYPQYIGHRFNFLADEIESTDITVEDLQTDYSID
jgi:hypothetical protein